MKKLEDLEKLQKLKDNRTITEAEFEIEKDKILNDKEKINKKKIKKIIKIGLTILISIAIIIGLIFLIKSIFVNVKIKKEENKIAQINPTELQEKIIKELEENEKINIETTVFKTTIGTSDKIDSDMLDFMLLAFEADYNLSESNDKMVYAFYEGNEDVIKENGSCIYIPLFRIETNEDGSFKKILFNVEFDYGYGTEVKDIVKNVLKTEYNIDIYGKYNSKNYKTNAQLMRINPYDKNGELTNRFLAILEGDGRFRFSVTPEMSNYVKMNAFGIDVNQ